MLCRNVRWYSDGSPRAPALETLLAEIRGQAPYIESHFRIEETVLFPFCEEALGMMVLPYLSSLQEEHRQLRDALTILLAPSAGDFSLLSPFAQQLHDHIRYEERYFFPLLQAHLSEDQWRTISERLG